MVAKPDDVTPAELWRTLDDLRYVIRRLEERGATRDDVEQAARSAEGDILRVAEDLRSERETRMEDVRRLHEKHEVLDKGARLARDDLEKRVSDKVNAVEVKVDALRQSQYDRLTARVTQLLVALVAAGAAGIVSVIVNRIG